MISYLLGPLVRTLENKVFRPLASKLYKKNKRSDGHGFARGMSILFSEIIMLAVIAALIYLIIPQLYSSIETIVVNSPTYIDNGTQWLTKLLEDYPEIEEYAVQALGDMNEFLANWLKNTVLPGLGNLITNVGAGVYYVVMAVYNLIYRHHRLGLYARQQGDLQGKRQARHVYALLRRDREEDI